MLSVVHIRRKIKLPVSCILYGNLYSISGTNGNKLIVQINLFIGLYLENRYWMHKATKKAFIAYVESEGQTWTFSVLIEQKAPFTRCYHLIKDPSAKETDVIKSNTK